MERFGLAPRGAPDPGRAGSAGRGGESAISARWCAPSPRARSWSCTRCGKCWRCMPPARSRCPCRRRGWRRWWPCSANTMRRSPTATRAACSAATSAFIASFRLAGQHGAGPGHRGIRAPHPSHPLRLAGIARLSRTRAPEHWAMIHALRDGDRDALMALCRDHLLPSRDAYLASERAGSAPVCCPADTPARNPPSRHGVVANPRDTYGYRCGCA